MKLDPDLIKNILEWAENNLPEEEGTYLSYIPIDGYSREEIKYHAELLNDNGYIKCREASHLRTPKTKEVFQFKKFPQTLCIERLTMNGHQYLNLLRSKAWKTAKELIHDVGVIFAEGAIKAVLDKFFSPYNTGG